MAALLFTNEAVYSYNGRYSVQGFSQVCEWQQISGHIIVLGGPGDEGVRHSVEAGLLRRLAPGEKGVLSLTLFFPKPLTSLPRLSLDLRFFCLRFTLLFLALWTCFDLCLHSGRYLVFLKLFMVILGYQ